MGDPRLEHQPGTKRAILINKGQLIFDGPKEEGLSRPWTVQAGLALQTRRAMLIGQGKINQAWQQYAESAVVSQALVIETDAIVTVSQLACLEDGCAPLETVIGLLQKIRHSSNTDHKPTDEITADDLLLVVALGDTTSKLLPSTSCSRRIECAIMKKYPSPY